MLVEERRVVAAGTRASGGKRPLVVFEHGFYSVCTGETQVWPCPPSETAVPSFRGYDAPAEALASHGYLVVSISANAVNAGGGRTADRGGTARGELVLAHLDLWRPYGGLRGDALPAEPSRSHGTRRDQWVRLRPEIVVPLAREVRFAPGQTRRTVSVTIRANTSTQPDQKFNVALTTAHNAALFDPWATSTVLDDD